MAAQEELQKLKIEGIKNEYDSREAAINDAYDRELSNVKILFDEKLIKENEYNQAVTDIETARERDIADLSNQKFQAGLGAARQIANAIGTIVGSGNRFVNVLLKALEVAEAIAAVIQAINILGSLFSAGAGAGAAAGTGRAVAAIPKAGGGVVANIGGKPYTAPYQKAIPKFAGGAKDFIVPPGFPNDCISYGSNFRRESKYYPG